MLSTPKAVEILADASHGQNLPQYVIQSLVDAGWKGITDLNKRELLSGPDEEFYWDSWNEVLDNATFEMNGGLWRLHQDGDLFALNETMMTPQEYHNFHGEYPEWFKEESE